MDAHAYHPFFDELDQLIEILRPNTGPDWEGPFLEFKGTYYPSKRHPDPDDGQSEMFLWNVAEALISFANNNGGFVILGIREDREDRKLHPHDWDPEDILQKPGKEAKDLVAHLEKTFFKRAQYSFVRENSEYTYCVGEEGRRVLSKHVQFVPCWHSGLGCNAIVAVVSPIERGADLIETTQTKKGVRETVVFHREDIGAHNGKITSLMEYARFAQNRTANAPRFAYARKHFFAADPLQLKSGRELSNKIRKLQGSQALDLCRQGQQYIHLREQLRYIPVKNEVLGTDVSDEGALDPFSDMPLGLSATGSRMAYCSPDGDVPIGSLETLLETADRVSIIGEPGCGKTVSIDELAARPPLSGVPPVVLKIPVRLIRTINSDDIFSIIRSLLPLDVDELQRIILERRLRLVFDGVNESVSARTPGIVIEFLKRNPDIPAIVTGRTLDDVRPFGFEVHAVLPLDDEQRRDFLAKNTQDGEARELNRLI